MDKTTENERKSSKKKTKIKENRKRKKIGKERQK